MKTSPRIQSGPLGAGTSMARRPSTHCEPDFWRMMSWKLRVKSLPPRVKVTGLTSAVHETTNSLPRMDVAPNFLARA